MSEQAQPAERAHHDYSPSSLQNLEACPCFQNRNEVNEAAVAGTLQHAVTETGQDNNDLTDDQMLAAAECMDFSDRIKQLFIEARDRAQQALQAANPGQTVAMLAEVLDLTETYLPIDDCVFEDVRSGKPQRIEGTTAGYVDRALISWDRREAAMIDYKFGKFKVVDAENNTQGIAYSLGMFKKFPSLQKVMFFFKQPALDHVTQATFTRAQVPELYLRIQTIVARAREARNHMESGGFDLATPNVPTCLFCGNLGRCPKVAAFACSVGKKFHPLEIPDDINPTGLQDSKNTALGLRLSQTMAVWARAFRAQLSDRVVRGDAPVPVGFEIASRSERKIVDAGLFKQTALKHLTTAELEAAADYGFGKVEKQISANAPRGSKKAAVESFQQELLEVGAVAREDSYSFLKAISD